jgi:hypothetical protein
MKLYKLSKSINSYVTIYLEWQNVLRTNGVIEDIPGILDKSYMPRALDVRHMYDLKVDLSVVGKIRRKKKKLVIENRS